MLANAPAFAAQGGMVARFFLVVALLFATPAAAQETSLEGSWAFRIDGATIFIFALSQSETGDWQARWTRPERFGSNGAVFSQLRGSESVKAMAAFMVRDEVEIAFPDNRPNAVPDIFRIRQVSENQASLTYVGTGFAPYPLVRVPGSMGLGPFDDGRIYDRDNAESEYEYIPMLVELEPEPEAALEPEPEPAPEPAAEAKPQPRITEDFLDGL